MKNPVNVKIAMLGACLFAITLLGGYALGYRQGVRDNERSWWSSAQIDREGKRVFLGPQTQLVENAPAATKWNSIPKTESTK